MRTVTVETLNRMLEQQLEVRNLRVVVWPASVVRLRALVVIEHCHFVLPPWLTPHDMGRLFPDFADGELPQVDKARIQYCHFDTRPGSYVAALFGLVLS